MKKKILVIFSTILLSFSLLKPVNIKAATGSVAVSVNSNSIVLGNKLTLTIKFSCSEGVGGGKIKVVYDNNYFTNITMISGNANLSESTGVILLEGTNKTSVTIVLTLTTKNKGNTSIAINTSEFINYEGDYVTGYSESITKSVSIIEKTNNNENTVTLSQDATLSSLAIDGMSFDKPFSSDVFEYTTYASEKIDSVTVKAATSSAKAHISNSEFAIEEGWNKLEVECIAEDGSSKKYIINLYNEETPTVFYNENLGVVKNLDNVVPIEGYQEQSIQVNEEELTIYTMDGINLIYLVNAEGKKDFYVYLKETNEVKDIYNPLYIGGNIYLKEDVDYSQFSELEEDFVSASVNINGRLVDGWKYIAENMKDYSLVYLTDHNGNKQLYTYDKVEGTLQRYTKPYIEVDDSAEKLQQMICYSLASAGVISFIVSLFIAGSKKKEVTK